VAVGKATVFVITYSPNGLRRLSEFYLYSREKSHKAVLAIGQRAQLSAWIASPNRDDERPVAFLRSCAFHQGVGSLPHSNRVYPGCQNPPAAAP